MKIEIKLDENCLETKVIIVTEKMTDEITALMQRLSEETPQGIVGFDGEIVQFLEPSEIVRIYSAVGKVFAVTDKKEFVLRLRLYEIEERLSSKSCAYFKFGNNQYQESKEIRFKHSRHNLRIAHKRKRQFCF